MKRLLFYPFLFLLSFFGMATLLLSLDTVQMQLVEKGALALEQALDSRLYFQRTDGLSCANIQLKGNYNFTVQKISFSIDPISLLYGSLSVNSIDLIGIEGLYDFHGKGQFNLKDTITLSGVLHDIPFYGKCAPDFSEGEFELPTWNGKIVYKGSDFEAKFHYGADITLNNRWIKIEKDDLLLEGPIAIHLEQVTSDALRLKWEEFDETLQVSYRIKERTLQGEGSFLTFLADIDDLSLCANLHYSGVDAELLLHQTEGQIHCTWKEQFDFDWKWSDGKATPFKLHTQYGDVKGLASFLKTHLLFEFEQLEGVPFELQKGGTCRLDLKEGLPHVIDVGFMGELSPLLRPWMSDTTLATGDFNARVHIENQILTGTLTIENGCYESSFLGCSFKDIQGKFHLKDNTLICDALYGRDSNGTISATGYWDLDRFEFDLDLKNVHLLHLDFAHGFATGKVTFLGNLDSAAFKGKLMLNRLDIRLPDTTPARLNVLPVEYVHQSQEETPPTLFAPSNTNWPVYLDIQLRFPRHAHVYGTQFSSEWSGAVDLKGTLDDPLFFGETKILRAEFLFNGKHFFSNEGTVRFNGPVGRKTTLYLIAKHDLDDTEIDVIVKGPLREPELAFRSNPPKSSREILSLILFNKPTGDMNIEESQELTRNIIKLSDQLSAGPNLLDRLKSSFGIDRIDITATDLDESVRVGKYLTNRLFLSLKKSMDDQPNQASIEADLTHNFKAQAEVSDDAEARLMLKWEKDY